VEHLTGVGPRRQQRNHFGRHCHADGELADGRVRVRVAAPTSLDIARNLAGWGAMVEVVEPSAVQAELARVGGELPGRYELGAGGPR
jgi:predicted DNA-binding transcriptional regulator YafY